MKRYFSSFLTLGLLLMSQSAMAKISPLAFKGVTKNLRKGKELYSPTLGAVALDFLISDIRFSGNFIPAYDENGQRLYKDDKSNDPLWNVVKTLFPSVNGVLGTDTQAQNNFASYVNDPAVVGALINYAYEVRKNLEPPSPPSSTERPETQENPSIESTTLNKEEINRLKLEINSLGHQIKALAREGENKDILKIKDLSQQLTEATQKLKTINSGKNSPRSNSKAEQQKRSTEANKRRNDLVKNLHDKMTRESGETIQSNLIEKFIKNIEASIAQEVKLGENSLYPTGTTEQVLLAFFDYKFDEQSDIWKLLRSYNDDLVDHELLEKTHPEDRDIEEDLLTPENIKVMPDQNGAFDLDDIFDLANAGVFTAITPYKQGVELLNNGKAQPYDRLHNKFAQDTFADCVETSVRHILNLMFYDPITKKFDVSHVHTPETQRPETDPTHQLKRFFETQSLSQTNAGDEAYRSAFNSIAGDLNRADRQGFPSVTYVKAHNELESGAINLVHVLSRILNIPLAQKVEELKSDEERCAWIKTSLKTLLDQSSDKVHDIEFADAAKGTRDDFFGNIVITAHDHNRSPLYSFRVKTKPGHGEVEDLKVLHATPKLVENLNEVVQSHGIKITPDTAESSIWLSSPELLKSHAGEMPIFYQLFSRPLNDNASRIEFLENLSDMGEKAVDFIKAHGPALNQTLGNILPEISWDDPEILRQISPIIFKLTDSPIFRDVLSRAVKGLKVDTQTELMNAVKYFPHLESLIWGLDSDTLPIELTKFTALKHMALNPENYELNFTMPTLKEIQFSPSGVKTLKGLSHTPNLEKLDLALTFQLKELEFTESLPHLKTIDLNNSAIQFLSGLYNLPNLEYLNLSETSALECLALVEVQPALKKINLMHSGIKDLYVFGNLNNLEKLNLSLTYQLKSVEFSTPLPSLKEVDLNNSALPNLNFNNLSNLEKLDLSKTFNLRSLEFEILLSSLKQVHLGSSSIHQLKNLSNAKHLELLRLDNTKELNDISFSNSMENLKHINIRGANLQTISGGEHLTQNCELEIDENQQITVTHKRGTAQPLLKVKGLGKIRYEEVDE